ncbi:MAG: retropepsin-like aspartic protease [Thermoplasmatota archaeon]|nr:retropepsin-like domain-containing protein [Candidatus Thermoplasmatota archaeon]MBU1914824.1 retropepsin-like domain-containing protein [Candidatus Thermoplasmatota archaeon]
MNFKYKALPRKGGPPRKTPTIPVTFIGPSDTVEIMAILDSGADISVLPLEVGQLLGLDLTKDKGPCGGIGGEVETAEDHVRVRVFQGHENYSFDIPVKVVLDPESNIPVLIGREGFFEEFEITFDERRERISLKKVAKD